MPPDILLVINCQQDLSYGNRRVLRTMYGERFGEILFTVGSSCPVDPEFPTLATSWAPRLLDNVCACCDPNHDPHPSGRHATHPRLVQVAEYAHRRGFPIVVFAEDDCILSPTLDPRAIRDRLENHDALIPYVGFCDRDSTSWIWTRHATGYPAFDVASPHFDRIRLLRHWSEFSGTVAPPILYAPMFGSFVDLLIFRTDLLVRMVPDLLALQDVWHEAAIPTALMHQTSRVGRLDGVALWNDERAQPREALFTLLNGKDYVHPIKLSYYPPHEILRSYFQARHESR